MAMPAAMAFRPMVEPSSVSVCAVGSAAPGAPAAKASLPYKPVKQFMEKREAYYRDLEEQAAVEPSGEDGQVHPVQQNLLEADIQG